MIFKTVAVFIFFTSFYKISIYKPFIYVSFLFSFMALVLLTNRYYRKKAVSVMSPSLVFSIVFILLWSLAVDLTTGIFFRDPTNTFFIRILSLIGISFLSAFLLVNYFFVKKGVDFVGVIRWAFLVQMFFWMVTFVYPELKFIFSSFMGYSDNAVNLRGHNLEVRGFGISSEINFTSPFMTVLVLLLFVRDRLVTLPSMLMQLINSNLVIFAIVVGVVFSKFKLHVKLLLIFSGVLAILFLGDEYFPRFFAEFKGDGSRTADALLNDHVNIVNKGILESIIGAQVYSFQGNSYVTSDIGWVNMYNYGGILFVFGYSILLVSISYLAFGFRLLTLVWFFAGVLLNTKGLLFGPNSYYFITFVFIFLRANGIDTLKREKNV